ncbi:MAG: QueT transporter family protein [Anaerolineales bacterium]
MKNWLKTKDIVFMATIGALYAVLTLLIAPISYGPIQFRVSEFLKIFCLFNPFTALGIAIGDIMSAILSPFFGPWELIFMPITDILGGILAYFLYRWSGQKYLAMAVYGLTTALSVAMMLSFLGVGGFLYLVLLLSFSEEIILLGGIPLVLQLMKIAKFRQIITDQD